MILPEPSTRTRYWWFWRVWMTWLASHRWVLGYCIATICPFWRGYRVCVVQLYHSMRRAFQQDRIISQFWAAAIQFACGLLSVGWDGMKLRSRRWSSSWAGDSVMFWMGVFLYWRIALAVGLLSNDFWAPVLPFTILLAGLTASSARPLDWG